MFQPVFAAALLVATRIPRARSGGGGLGPVAFVEKDARSDGAPATKPTTATATKTTPAAARAGADPEPRFER